MSRHGSNYDVIIIGGGPSGMMAAGRACERGRRVLLLEKNRKLGKKLSITGGGRCNILNAEEDSRALLANFDEATKYLHSPYSQFTNTDAVSFFESHGLPIVVEARKRAFPKSQSAPDVTKVMSAYASGSGSTILTGVRCEGFILNDGIITGVKTTAGDFFAESFVLATGGMSHEETGASIEGVTWLSDLGHTIHESSPDVVPLKAEENWVKELSGTTLSFMNITFGIDRKKSEGRFSRLGKILFTHFGVSGPLILNSAHEVKKLLIHGPVHSVIDLYPDTEIGTLRNRILAVFDQNKNKALKNVLKEFVPHGLSEAVAAQLGEEMKEMKVHSVGKEERHELADRLKAMPLTITATMGYDWAVVSDGGVDLSEVDMKTMASKLHKNLFFTGDVLHISRPSGGYSLQLCWTTGYIAGQNV